VSRRGRKILLKPGGPKNLGRPASESEEILHCNGRGKGTYCREGKRIKTKGETKASRPEQLYDREGGTPERRRRVKGEREEKKISNGKKDLPWGGK